jgi:hypothetical protein
MEALFLEANKKRNPFSARRAVNEKKYGSKELPKVK